MSEKWKTARQLGISSDLREALGKVHGMLASGELRHQSDPAAAGDKDAFKYELWRDIRLTSGHGCGTVACIGGWCSVFTRHSVVIDVNSDTHDLFYGGMKMYEGRDYDACGVTTYQAAEALENYLTTGKAHWERVLGKPKARRGVLDRIFGR